MKLRNKVISIALILAMLFAFGNVAVFAVQTPKATNIIYMVGDGMGPNQLAAYKQAKNIDKLNMEQFPIAGYQVTRSFGKILTDSAAGGTALACGTHTWVNAVGVYPGDPFCLLRYPMNMREVAAEKGMKTGIVVTKSSDDATPAAFSAHTYARGNDKIINEQQLNSGIDVLMGASTGLISKEQAAEKGYAFVENRNEMNSIASGKVIGQYNGGELKNGLGEKDAPSLKEMAEKAIALLENEKGYFLMIEGSTIDSFGHSNDLPGLLTAMESFEDVVKYVLDYAKAQQNTIVVITADHETGGLTYDEAKKEYYFTTGGHTNTNVPYFAYIPDGMETPFVNEQQLLNIDVPRNVARTFGWDEDVFPREALTDAGKKLSFAIQAGHGLEDFLSNAFNAVIPSFIVTAVSWVWVGFVDGISSIVALF